jgi:hypothetical protein
MFEESPRKGTVIDLPPSAMGAAQMSSAMPVKHFRQIYRHTHRNAGFHRGHGHMSLMACITPIRALALHFSRCWLAHSLKASTIASFDTNDFGHAEGTDIVIKSGRSLMSFNSSPFLKT